MLGKLRKIILVSPSLKYQNFKSSIASPQVLKCQGLEPWTLLYRSFLVWVIGIVVVLGSFLFFVALGWPGSADNCAFSTPNTCYCESFVVSSVSSNLSGVRQIVNTWFNLYAIGTSFIIAQRVYKDRLAGLGFNSMQDKSWIPDIYVFAVLFLGLGSMWFHASLKTWAGNLDNLSMYLYVAFLVFYTAKRLWNSELLFWIGYPLTVLGFTVINVVWQWQLKSLLLTLILVVSYFLLELVVWLRKKSIPQGRIKPFALWVAAVIIMATATLFWTLSQTGKPLCNPDSVWQLHGLLWHPLPGVTGVLLYFYWRSEQCLLPN